MKKIKILSLLWLFFFISVLPVHGQDKKQPPQYRQETAPVSVHQISKHVYDVRGGVGANSAFIVGDNAVYVIDAKMTEQSAKDMVKTIKKTTGKPIKYLILTHSDGDHVNGIPGFSKDVDMIAHKNSARDIKKANEAGQITLPLPNITFTNSISLFDDDLEIRLLYFGPAHTDGSIVVYIPDDRIAVIGDLFFKGMDPLIHKHKNGISSGFADVLQKIAGLDAKEYLSGHSDPVEKAEIEELRNTIKDKREKVKSMISDGRSLDDIKKAFGIPTGQQRWPSLVEIIYSEMTQ